MLKHLRAVTGGLLWNGGCNIYSHGIGGQIFSHVYWNHCWQILMQKKQVLHVVQRQLLSSSCDYVFSYGEQLLAWHLWGRNGQVKYFMAMVLTLGSFHLFSNTLVNLHPCHKFVPKDIAGTRRCCWKHGAAFVPMTLRAFRYCPIYSCCAPCLLMAQMLRALDGHRLVVLTSAAQCAQTPEASFFEQLERRKYSWILSRKCWPRCILFGNCGQQTLLSWLSACSLQGHTCCYLPQHSPSISFPFHREKG